MDGHRDTFEPGPPPPPPGAPRDRMTLALVFMGGLITLLLVVLIVVLLAGDDQPGIAVNTPSTNSPSTSEPTPTTTAPTTTAAPVTTAIAATTVAPWSATTVDKTCTEPSIPAMKVSEIQFAKFDVFTRITFIADDGEVAPGCFVGYVIDQLTLSVMFFPVSTLDPFAAGIFDDSGYLAIGVGSVIGVDSGGQGGGSGEWFFEIDVDSFSAFAATALPGPSRLVVDIGD